MKIVIALSLGCLLFIFGIGCESEKSEFIGTVVDVGCGGAASVSIGGEVFDMRPHNNCGNGSGLIRYSKTAESESGAVTAELQIACGAGFCISQVKVNSWKTN